MGSLSARTDAMKILKCAVPVNFKDTSDTLVLDAIDIGPAYRIVFRWADSTEFPDQGAIPGMYVDKPKHLVQDTPDLNGTGVFLLCNEPIDLDVTEAEMLS